MEFKSFHDGRFHVHVYNTSQFKTNHLSIRLVRPLSRETVTPTALLPYLWMEGSESYPTAELLQRRTDELYGASVRTGITKRGDRHVVEAYVGVPDETGLGEDAKGLTEEAIHLLFEVVTHPALEGNRFPDKHVSREKTLHQHRIESIFDDKIAFAADRCLAEASAGENAGLPRLGYVEDVRALTADGMLEIHKQVLATSDVHLYAVGNWGSAEEMGKRLLNWIRSSFPPGELVDSVVTQALSPKVGTDAKVVTEEQRVTQGKLDIAYRTGLSVAHPDYPAMMVMNGILGGFTHSKLFQNVREKASLAYYCSSRFDNLTGIVLIQTGIEVGNYERALSIVREQVSALQNGEITDDEMEFTKSSIRNQYTQISDFPMSVADVHFNLTLAGASRTIDDLLKQVDRVTPKDVARVAGNLQMNTIYLLKDKEVVAYA